MPLSDSFQRRFKEWSTVIAALILGISVIIGTVVVSNMVTFVKTFNASQIAVTGSAQRKVTSNEVKWTGQFSVNTPLDVMKAGYAGVAREKAQVMAFLKRNGVSAQEVTVSPVKMSLTYPQLKWNPQAAVSLGKAALSDYTLTQTVIVQSGDVNGITSLAQSVGSLVNQGVNFSTQSLQYYYTKLAQIRGALEAKAMLDAKARAAEMVGAAGGRLGPLVSVKTGVLQLTPVNSTETSGGGTYDTTTIQKKLTAVVRASFRLAR